MHPWLIHFPPVSTYGACIVIGLALAWIWARNRAPRAGVSPSHIDLLMPVLVGAGLLGAWLFGAWTDEATGNEGSGAVLVGALLIATAGGIAYAVSTRIPLGVLGDICGAPLALGIGIGRLGCFFAGCCYGRVSDPQFGVRFPRDSFAFLDQVHRGLLPPDAPQSLPVYPTQLYESGLCLLLALLLWGLGRRVRVSGEQFLWVGIGYALLRFMVEFFRGDNPAVVQLGQAGLTFSQVAAVGILLLAAGTGVVRRRFAGRWGLRLAPERRSAIAG